MCLCDAGFRKLFIPYKLCFILITTHVCTAGLVIKSNNNHHIASDANDLENNANSYENLNYFDSQTNGTHSTNAFQFSPTVWVMLAVLLLISSGCTFVYIAVSKLKAEHKKRMAKSKTVDMQLKNVQNDDDLEDDMIFKDEFNIVPRGGSFIGQIFRQISNKKTNTNTSET